MTVRAASSTAAPPAPAAASGDPFVAQVLQAQDELARSVERAGLTRDPYRFVMGALSHSLGLFPAFVQRLDAAIDHARQPIDHAAVERLEAAAASGAARRAGELARAHTLRTVLAGAAVLAGAVLAAAGGGFWWGRSTQAAVVSATEAGVSAAFREGPAAAASWLNLMQSNDPAQALATCAGGALTVVGGRRACAVPLWLDPPKLSAPGARQ